VMSALRLFTPNRRHHRPPPKPTLSAIIGSRGARPSNAPRSIFLLSGQSYRLISSCRNEIAESSLARSGCVHAVGGQTLDL